MIQFLQPAMYDLPHPSLDRMIELASELLELLDERHGLNETRLLLTQVKWMIVKLREREESLHKQIMYEALDSLEDWNTIAEQEDEMTAAG